MADNAQMYPEVQVKQEAREHEAAPAQVSPEIIIDPRQVLALKVNHYINI